MVYIIHHTLTQDSLVYFKQSFGDIIKDMKMYA